jgi:hypothetical protein
VCCNGEVAEKFLINSHWQKKDLSGRKSTTTAAAMEPVSELAEPFKF